MTSESKKKISLKDVFTGQVRAIEQLARRLDNAVSDKLIEQVLRAKRIFVTGQGRSGLIAQCLATRLAQMGFSVHVPGQATCQKIESGDLMIAISCSGKTATTTQFAKISAEAGAGIAVISTRAGSVLAKLADEIIILGSDEEEVLEHCEYAVGPGNNTLFEQATLLYIDALVYVLLERKGFSKDIIVHQHTNLE